LYWCFAYRAKTELSSAMPASLTKVLWPTSITALGVGCAVLGYSMLRGQLVVDVYRQKLGELAEAHEQLGELYNSAVRRTAVTELVVRPPSTANRTHPTAGTTRTAQPADYTAPRVTVRVRAPGGVLKEVDTPLDPDREIYVDYVVLDGRLWIRRVFDSGMKPEDAVVIDPIADGVDWSSDLARVGKAVYRRLTPGRWVVTVTGSGSLGLERIGDADSPGYDDNDLPGRRLSSPPEIREFAEIEHRAKKEAERIGVASVVERILGH